MCGELDENVQIGRDLLEQLAVMAKMMGHENPVVDQDQAVQGARGPAGLSHSPGRAAYMDSLFHAGLTRALHDSSHADPEETVDAIASQAIAFARLAGFLAGQLPPEADLFRGVTEAVMSGHSETARLRQTYRKQQDDAHGHSHDETDGHGHNHHHDHGDHKH